MKTNQEKTTVKGTTKKRRGRPPGSKNGHSKTSQHTFVQTLKTERDRLGKQLAALDRAIKAAEDYTATYPTH